MGHTDHSTATDVPTAEAARVIPLGPTLAPGSSIGEPLQLVYSTTGQPDWGRQSLILRFACVGPLVGALIGLISAFVQCAQHADFDGFEIECLLMGVGGALVGVPFGVGVLLTDLLFGKRCGAARIVLTLCLIALIVLPPALRYDPDMYGAIPSLVPFKLVVGCCAGTVFLLTAITGRRQLSS